MAKDGTRRGGARPGSGRKPKALADRIKEGTEKKSKVLIPDSELNGADIPPVSEYLKAEQKNGIDLCAVDVYNSTFAWLKRIGCDSIVNSRLVEQYSMSVARYVQCEQAISEFGFLAKHPTTGAAIASPYVSMSQNYLKQVNQTWYQIYQIVKENCATEFGGKTPQDDLMEKLLTGGKS